MSTMIQICQQVPAEIVRAPYFDFDDPVLSMFVCVWRSEFPVSRVVCNSNRSEFSNQHFDNVCFRFLPSDKFGFSLAVPI